MYLRLDSGTRRLFEKREIFRHCGKRIGAKEKTLDHVYIAEGRERTLNNNIGCSATRPRYTRKSNDCRSVGRRLNDFVLNK